MVFGDFGSVARTEIHNSRNPKTAEMLTKQQLSVLRPSLKIVTDSARLVAISR